MILVTGGTGLLGAHLLLALCQKNDAIVATYRRPSSLESIADFFRGKEPNHDILFKKIIWKKAPLSDLSALGNAFDGITKVYHCAAKVSFAKYHDEALMNANQQGTANIVNIALQKGVQKMVYVSSIAAIDSENPNEPITEDSTWNYEKRHTGYALSKHAAEMEVWRGTQEGLTATIINPGVILGGHFWKRSSGVFWQRTNRKLIFCPSGNLGVVGVSDVVRVLVMCMEKPYENERYILVNQNVSYQELFKKIVTTLHKKPLFVLLPEWLLKAAILLGNALAQVFFQRPFFSKALVNTLCSKRVYDGSKITRETDFEYSSLDDEIRAISSDFLNHQQ